MPSAIVINALGVLTSIYMIRIKYMSMSIIIISLIGFTIGLLEVSTSDKKTNDKIKILSVITIFSLAEIIISKTVLENFIKNSNLNQNHTLINELMPMLDNPNVINFLIMFVIIMLMTVILLKIKN